jgi:hypothetical protein
MDITPSNDSFHNPEQASTGFSNGSLITHFLEDLPNQEPSHLDSMLHNRSDNDLLQSNSQETEMTYSSHAHSPSAATRSPESWSNHAPVTTAHSNAVHSNTAHPNASQPNGFQHNPSQHSAYNDKVVPMHPESRDTSEIEALKVVTAQLGRELSQKDHKIANLESALWAMDSQAKAMEARVLQMEQQQQKDKHDQIEVNRLRHAQNLQLERRLQDYVKEAVKEAVHIAIERFARVRSEAKSKQTAPPSTYLIPQRLANN